MDSMKIEIEVPVVPEGWRVVGLRPVLCGQMWLDYGDWKEWNSPWSSTSLQIVAERIHPPIVLDPRLVAVLRPGWIARADYWYWFDRKPVLHGRKDWWNIGGKAFHLLALDQALFPDVPPEDSLFEIKGDA